MIRGAGFPVDLRLLMLAVAICLGIYVRGVDLDVQFTHIDDLGVAESILVQDELYTPEYLRRRIHDSGHEAYNSLPYKALRGLDAAGRLETTLPTLRVLMKAVIVPWVWTYAPFQFPLTSLLISRNQDYRQIMFWGRLPSFLFGCLALALIVVVFRRILGDGYFLAAFTGVLLLALSWENIVYAKHMSSYGIGVFAGVALLIALARATVTERPTTKFSLMLGIVLAVLSHMQYQLLFFLPAFYLAWLAAIFCNAANRVARLRHLVVTAAIHAAATLPMVLLFLLHRTERGVTWSGFFSFPILFDPDRDATLLARAEYALGFFATNFYRIVQFLFSFAPPELASAPVAVILILAMITGMYRLLTSSVAQEKILGMFLALSGASIVGLVLMQKLTFGPTRHSLILFPYLAILVAFGVQALADRLLGAAAVLRNEVALAGALFFCFLATFLPGVDSALRQRHDLFEESELAALAVRYQPDFVVAKAAGNLSMMSPFKAWPREYSPGLRTFTLFRNPRSGRSGAYMLVNFGPFSDENVTMINRDFGLSLNPSGVDALLYRREENTGACVDVCAEKRTGENAIWVQLAQVRATARPQ